MSRAFQDWVPLYFLYNAIFYALLSTGENILIAMIFALVITLITGVPVLYLMHKYGYKHTVQGKMLKMLEEMEKLPEEMIRKSERENIDT